MAVKVETPICPACAGRLSQEGRSAGLCPSCLLELALDDTALEAELRVEPGEAPTLQFTPNQTFSEGDIQGERYRIRSLLGRGGMGEVWRAYDLKLRLDVALKALRVELLADGQALETLRQEVRVAREVISPNVCRVYDLEEVDGQELVSMEYVDGTTLQEILGNRGPLDLNEAREIASQFLAGLEAIHEAGLVHRDIKPENLMLTRTGRVVVMDFGIAKGLGDGKTMTVAGTPAYMSPEHAQGEDLDGRADLFSAGVVLTEMVEPRGVHSFEDRRRVWEDIHRDKPQVSDTPWSKVIAKAVAPERQERFASASALARALEEVTLRATGDETARPYPGLSAFQEEDAEFFYGRELEVEALWKKLRRPHLVAVIGPSGAGKSSLLRAGLLPTLPPEWRAIIATPGSQPFENLAKSLAPELSDAPGSAELLPRFDKPEVALELLSEWRQAHGHVLVIVDQFEELFTQNPQDSQGRFAELLSRLPLEADVHVLLSMRDDFVMQCHRFEALRPIFSELSPLDPPLGSSLQRALIQPALKCGYRFEDESIVEEMLAEVEGERGALPMMAFAAAQLWEERDRESGLLTREAYEQIGGVAGALAQHAEASLERVGESGVPIVRELFRNLVTAQGTRVARDREELLSVFGESRTAKAGAEAGHYKYPDDVGAGLVLAREGARPSPTSGGNAAESVLDTLIDARLLTSYEVPAADNDDTPHQRIEVVHESLLSNWPRLVRWQTQDAEGAKLRDELRSQARLWHEHGRSEDYLWTGTAFKEYELWRERYPGRLTAAEEDFTHAMTAHAQRRDRRKRIAVAAVIVILLAVLSVVTWSRFEAVGQARRAEAANLLAQAQLRQDEDPTEALAYTTASLELADSEEARVYAVRLLWGAPPALELAEVVRQNNQLAFSPDGSRLAVAGCSEDVQVWSDEGELGNPPVVVFGGQAPCGNGANQARWAGNHLLVSGNKNESVRRMYSIPEGHLVREIALGGAAWTQVMQDRLLAEVLDSDPATGDEILRLRAWRLPDGEPEELGAIDNRTWHELGWSNFAQGGDGYMYGKGNEVFIRPLPVQVGVPDVLVGSHENEARHTGYPVDPDRYWTRDQVTGELRMWDLSGDEPELGDRIPALEDVSGGRLPDPSGSWLVDRFSSRSSRQARIWDRTAWPEARPLRLRRSGSWYAAMGRFHPDGKWLAITTHSMSRLTFWPLNRSWPHVADGYSNDIRPLAVSPDGKWLATGWTDDSGEIRIWPLPGNGSMNGRTLTLPEGADAQSLAFDPLGRYLFAVGKQAHIVPLDGSPPRQLDSQSEDTSLLSAAVSASGRKVATTFGFGHGGERTLRVWDVESGVLQALDLPPGSPNVRRDWAQGIWEVDFIDDSSLHTAGDGGIRRWDLETGDQELLFPTTGGYGNAMALSTDHRTAVVGSFRFGDPDLGPITVVDLISGESRVLPAFVGTAQGTFPAFDLDTSGTVVVVGDTEGVIRVARVSDGEPHLLLGHEGAVESVAISPNGRWIVSVGEDNTLRLWPMPDLDKPPLHTLPHDELVAKLKSLTNIRLVRDPESAEGWTFTLDPFPGWKEVPTWQ